MNAWSASLLLFLIRRPVLERQKNYLNLFNQFYVLYHDFYFTGLLCILIRCTYANRVIWLRMFMLWICIVLLKVLFLSKHICKCCEHTLHEERNPESHEIKTLPFFLQKYSIISWLDFHVKWTVNLRIIPMNWFKSGRAFWEQISVHLVAQCSLKCAVFVLSFICIVVIDSNLRWQSSDAVEFNSIWSKENLTLGGFICYVREPWPLILVSSFFGKPFDLFFVLLFLCRRGKSTLLSIWHRSRSNTLCRNLDLMQPTMEEMQGKVVNSHLKRKILVPLFFTSWLICKVIFQFLPSRRNSQERPNTKHVQPHN